MTDRELMQQALDALEIYGANSPDVDQTITALRERLAQPEQDWDWRHPKAQALIGAKARLEIKLRLIEQLVDDPSFEPTALDMEYWEPLHDKLNERLAQPRQWQSLTDEEIQTAWASMNHDPAAFVHFAGGALWAESKLKEKNG